MFALAKKFLGHVIPGVIRPIHILWNQVIGFFFLVLAGMGVSGVVRSWGRQGREPQLVISLCFVVLMAWFGLSSFLKARKISKS